MELINATPMVAGYTLGLDPEGREYLVVVVKGTFDIPADGGEARLSGQQQPLIEADTFTGEPGFSAPVYESDYCLSKPKCDVLVLGSAHAPGGKPVTQLKCGFKIGSLSKVIEVYGDRTWSGPGNTPSRPEPLVTMPISYDRAFGGCDASNPDKARAFTENPVGMGYWPNLSSAALKSKPVPNLQEPGKSLTSPRSAYRPMSLGPLGRSWSPRLQYAGTYDDEWLENDFPFLPRDFDERYHQAAPTDQQTDHLQGGEPVALVNLTPDGRRSFALPVLECPVEFTDAGYVRQVLRPEMDTLVLEPELLRFSVVLRARFPLPRGILSARQVVIGRMPRGWYTARDKGKTYVGRPVAQNPLRRPARSEAQS